MSVKQIDATGKACPIPVIEAKKALAGDDATGASVRVDNIIAVQNLEKMASGYGYGFSYSEGEGGIFTAMISKGPGAAGQPAPFERAPGKKPVVLISSDTLGNGEQELGKILMKGFIYSLTELAETPSAVIFINRGAFLTAAGANTVPDITVLAEKGAEVLTCGTCSKYYGLAESLACGQITDMFGIVERLAAAGSVISL